MFMEKLLVVLVIVLSLVCNTFAIPANGPATLYEGFISYHGSEIDGNYVPWIDMLENWNTYKSAVQLDFRDIHDRFHAKAVRLLVHPMIPEWNYVGMDFPVPTPNEISNLADIIDTAYSEGLQVYLVMLIPDAYHKCHPDWGDTWYSNNALPLIDNLYTFWNNIFGQVVSSRVNKIYYVDIMGDFDPLNVYGQFATPTEQWHHQEWWRRIWPNFYSWYTYIPNSKKTFELIGGVYNPKQRLNSQIDWVQGQLSSRGWPTPDKWGVEIYTSTDWLDSYYSWWEAYKDLFISLQANVGGYDHLIIEEVGSNTGCNDCTDDGLGGCSVYSASFAALESLDSNVPIGVWTYWDTTCATNGQWGLYTYTGTLKQGWWVLPWFFEN